jgi:MoxR-like ATPase
MHIDIDYPDAKTELEILRLTRGEALQQAQVAISELNQAQIFEARKAILNIHLAPQLEDYIVQLVIATRQPEKYDDQLRKWISFGASPRATISLDRCARAKAWLSGRDFVTPDDIQAVYFNVLRHRLLISYEAEAEGLTSEKVLARILDFVAVP